MTTERNRIHRQRSSVFWGRAALPRGQIGIVPAALRYSPAYGGQVAAARQRSPTATRGRGVIAALLAALIPAGALAADWPTYQHDFRRSGVTEESLAPVGLKPLWTYHAPSVPQRAFPGPAPRDYYNAPKVDLKPRMDFDRVFHVVVAEGRVFFGSSVEDFVCCVDAATGERRWTYFTEGPVRMAPTWSDGRIYAGSDDGHVYCLDAANGTRVWKRRVADRDYRVPSNGKFISLWPVRSGVVVEKGVAYCSAGFLPSESVYIAALDAATGGDRGPNRWRHAKAGDYSLQGYLLASADKLYMPAGREPPHIFSRSNGESLGQLKGGGGTYCLLTDDSQIVFGPSRSGGLELSTAEKKSAFVTFSGDHLIVHREMSYLQAEGGLRALDRRLYNDLTAKRIVSEGRERELSKQVKALGKDLSGEKAKAVLAELRKVKLELGRISRELSGTVKWSASCEQGNALILAGDLLIAGGRDEVAAYAVKSGAGVWKQPVSGGVYGLAVAGQRLFVSTDNGRIYAFGR